MNVGDLDRIIIAYEPIWSIGTNNIPSVKEISETVQFIKTYVEKHFHSNIRVLYGGSVNVENILMIRNIEEIDGILVGDASTRASEFLDIIDAFFIRQNQIKYFLFNLGEIEYNMNIGSTTRKEDKSGKNQSTYDR